MAWNPYTDQKNRAYSGILTTLFPEQTKTLPRILIWITIFMADLILGILAAVHFGLLSPDSFASVYYGDLSSGSLIRSLLSLLVLAGIFAIFWLQGKIWFGIVNFFKKRNQLD